VFFKGLDHRRFTLFRARIAGVGAPLALLAAVLAALFATRAGDLGANIEDALRKLSFAKHEPDRDTAQRITLLAEFDASKQLFHIA
jgi:hypothetical protein